MNDHNTSLKHTKIFVAGHRGMVGSAIVRQLLSAGHTPDQLVTRTRAELDLTDQAAVRAFFAQEKPTEVYLAAAKVGGIHANNTYPAEFIYDNLMVEANIIDAAFRQGVKKLLFLGSSCIYPKLAAQPMAESALLTGTLEPTNEPYAIAKIAGIKLCEFLYVDDMASASIHVMNLPKQQYETHTLPMQGHINVGYGSDVTIAELATTVGKVVGYQGQITFDATKPDGAPRKLMDSGRLRAFGWTPKVDLEQGLGIAYQDFLTKQ